MIQLELISINIFLVRVTLKIGQEKYLLAILLRKIILGPEKIIGSFHEKELFRVNYKWVIIQNDTVILDIKLK